MIVIIQEGYMSDRIRRNAKLMKVTTQEYVESCLERYWSEFGYGPQKEEKQ